MKQASNRLMIYCAAILLVAGSNAAVVDAYQAPQKQSEMGREDDSSGSFCLDSMETIPFSDDLEPTPISVDSGCSVSEGTIAT